jgi:hypothetical protein
MQRCPTGLSTLGILMYLQMNQQVLGRQFLYILNLLLVLLGTHQIASMLPKSGLACHINLTYHSQ